MPSMCTKALIKIRFFGHIQLLSTFAKFISVIREHESSKETHVGEWVHSKIAISLKSDFNGQLEARKEAFEI